MADKLLFVVVSSNPDSEAEITSILSQAKTAAAMEFDVEVIFSGLCDVLAKQGHGDKCNTIYTVLKEGHDNGVSYKVCPRPFEDWDAALLTEIDEVVGSAYIISEAMNEDTTTFTY